MKNPSPVFSIRSVFRLAVVCACITGARAADRFKVDNTTPLNSTGSWSTTSGGASGASVPGGGDRAIWDSTLSAASTVASLGGNLTWGGMEVLSPGASLDISAGSDLTLNGSQATDIDMSGATVNLTFDCNVSPAGSQLWNIAAGQGLTLNGSNSFSGSFKLSGSGSLVFNGVNNSSIGSGNGMEFNGGTTTFMAGSTFNSAGNGYFYIGNNSTASVTNNGGTITLNTSSGALLKIGAGSGSGTLVNNSGSFTFTADSGNNAVLGDAGTGVLTLIGGTVTQVGANAIVLGNAVGGSGTLQLNGGTLTVRQLRKGSGSGTAFFNGGTLKANGASTTFIGDGGTANLTAANISAGGLLLDTGGFALTIPQPFAEDPAATGGGFTKNGAGTVTLTGNSTFPGATTVNTGTLAIGSGGTAGSLMSASLVDNAAVSFSRSDATTFAGNISGTGNVTKQGGGALTLSGDNTYQGTTTLSAGTLNINSAAALGTGAFTIGATATINNTSGSPLTLTNNNAQNWNANFTFTGSSDLNLGTGAVTLGANRTVTVSAGNLTVGGAISGNFNLTKAGAGNLILGGANNYGGTTTISAGTLALGAGGGLSGTPSITIAAGSTFDVSAPGSYTLATGTSLFSSGSVQGNLIADSSSVVRAGTDGGYATATFNGNLAMTSGSTFLMDVNATAAGPNDAVAVSGGLTLNNTVFNLNAPTAGATIDTGSDYTLVTAGSIIGTPVLNWVTAPANSGNYSLVVAGNAITLHYGGVVAGSAPVIDFAASGGQLTLSWDTNSFPGYSVEAQTNSSGISNNWINASGVDASPVMFPLDPANPSVFFRLIK